ncbi:MAG: radical SAM protein [bacterium]|nr:radical SAM protein [bacterium]
MNDALMNTIANGLAEEIIKSDVTLYWDGYLRVDNVTCKRENVMLWRRGGMYRTRIGIESGSQHVLDLMDKGITVEQTRTTVANLAYAGIKTTAYIVIGHPGETEEDFQQTLDLVEELKNDIWEVECNPFIFSYTGQAKSHQWTGKSEHLYPEYATDKLIIQSWTMDCEPSRQETYDRVCRFVRHCEKLGIPNPYSLHDIYKADERWKKLHKNAVPSLVDLKDKNLYIDECKGVKEITLLENKAPEEGDFDF